MIVIDTNIVLDLFVFKDPLAQPLAQALANQTYQWIATAPMRDELERVLDYPTIALRLDAAQISATEVLVRFDAQVQRMDVAPRATLICRDPDDQKFIDLALAHQAMLLSKDRAVLCMAKRLLAGRVIARSAIELLV
jgi:putative PIN family toxin of toxin-antitoxin system